MWNCDKVGRNPSARWPQIVVEGEQSHTIKCINPLLRELDTKGQKLHMDDERFQYKTSSNVPIA